MPEIRTEILEEQLNDFDPEIRSTALAQLSEKAMNGEIRIHTEREVANMH